MAFNNLEDLGKWFMDNAPEGRESINWKIFNGRPGKNMDAGRGFGKTQEEAWATLHGTLENMIWEPGEYVTVWVYSGSNFNGARSETVYRPIPKMAYAGGSQQSPGIGGINSQAYISEQISKEMTIYDLKRQVEDLNAALNEKQNIFDRVINTIVEHPNFDPNALIQGIGNIVMNLMPKRAQVGVQGFQQATAADPAAVNQEEAGRIAAALERLQMQFPEIPLSRLLEGLAGWVEQNPAMARGLLQNILK